MGQTLRRVKTLTGRNSEEAELARRRQYELSLPGIPRSLSEAYEVKDLLHDGIHGRVYSLSDSKTGRPLAMKAFWKVKRSFQFLDVHKHALAIEELRTCQLRHEHLCHLVGFFESKDLFCVVTERCDGGSVREHLQEKLQLDDYAAAKIFSQALGALAYLHARRIVHRDLRPEQLLYTSKRRTRLKLCDLMHAARPREGKRLVDETKPSMLLFAAPESLTRGEYSAMSDMWGAGCCLFELLYGHPPLTGEDEPLVRRIVEEEPDYAPLFFGTAKKAVELLGALLCKEPARRRTARQAMAHGWFQSAQDIAQAQRRAEAARQKKLLSSVAELMVMRRRKVGTRLSEDGPVLPSQYSRSLTGSCSHLSDSTPSDAEDRDDASSSAGAAEPPTEGLGSGEHAQIRPAGDSESEDWRVGSERSDLVSGPPPSGRESHSDTYVNSETEFFARTKGHWDEFDSEFFEEDRQASSCWSEAEYSDWTPRSQLKREHDEEFSHWLAGLGSGKREDGRRGAAEVDPSSQEGDEQVRENDHGSPRSTSVGCDQVPREEARAPPLADLVSGQGGIENAADDRAKEGQSSEASSALGSRALSRHSSEELELAARDRSEGSGLKTRSGSGWSSSRSSLAPWDCSEGSRASGTSSSSASGKSQGGQERAAARRKAEDPAVTLATIDERAELVETIGEVTNRSLAAQSAPQEAGVPRSGGIIVLSRRSNSSSSSSARDGSSSRNEFGLAHQRSVS